jgi:hypothetical protein
MNASRMMANFLQTTVVGEGLPVLVVPGWQMDGKAAQVDFEPVSSKVQGLRQIYIDPPKLGGLRE